MFGIFWKHVKALLATARVANVPSVVGNVWVGAVVARLVRVGGETGDPVGNVGGNVWWLAAAGVCLYVAGNFLNDWYDREWDAEKRPERALPSGLFCPCTYLSVALGLVVMAGVCAWVVNEAALVVAGVILVFVVVYTVLHKRTGWGVVWVGLCRALLLVLGGMSEVGSGPWNGMLGWIVTSIPLFCYIVGLSVSARFEAKGQVPAWASGLSVGMLVLPMVMVVTGVTIASQSFVIPMAVIPFAAWMVVCYWSRKNIPRYVGGLLAGIPLVDLMVLGGCIQTVAGDRWVITPMVMLIPLAAFAAGLLLQRIAPAS